MVEISLIASNHSELPCVIRVHVKFESTRLYRHTQGVCLELNSLRKDLKNH